MNHSVNYISMVEKTDRQYHRSPIILHRENMYYLAEFQTQDQLDEFARMMGFTYTLRKEETSSIFGWYREYDIDRVFDDTKSFYHHAEVPEEAKWFMALSNGGIVPCYFVNDGKTITIYRMNPNARCYNPLPVNEHISYQRRYGRY